MIEAKDLCKQFERNVRQGRRTKKESFLAVDHISLEARQGEIIGILGPNGAGKTTLLRMLGMLMTPTEGTIRLTDAEGNEITDATEKKAAIGYLSGNTKLYLLIFSAGFVAFALFFSLRPGKILVWVGKILNPCFLVFLGELYGFDKATIRERTEEIFRVLDMESFGDNRIEKLSTGQTQRASIARCLMADPELYILDEPTLGLDILSADAIIRFMKGQKAKGKTVLYSTHYLEEAQILCDRIYMIRDGKLAAQGTPEALMEQTGTDSLREAFHAIYDA